MSHTLSTSADPVRVLIVEDDPMVSSFCARLLHMKGFAVKTACNGREALDILQTHPFDLVLTDLQMPEMGGMALLRELREHYADLDAIMFTAYATVDTAREALKLGAFDYLTKPFSVDELERTVRRAVEWRRVRQERQRLSEVVALYEISQTFTSTLDTDTAVREIVELLWRRFSPAALSPSLVHPEDHELELLAHRGTPAPALIGVRVLLRQEPGYDSLFEQHAQLINRREPVSPSHLARLVLRSNDRPVGVLDLIRAPDQPGFDSDDRTLLAICASQIAASLDNSRLYRQLKQQNLETIVALAAAIDARDPYTAGHSLQVMQYAVRLGEVVGLEHDRIEALRYGGLLHDIGKIGVPDAILLKPTHLSPEEMEIMRAHVVIGVEIVRGIKALRAVLPIIRYHHERIDGAGYPDGLSGDQIPLEARIMAIADAYDTMTSDRAYRRAMSQEEAIAELQRGRGSQWDSGLIDRFIELVQAESHTLRLPQPRAVQALRDQAAHMPNIELPRF
ncbi:HD domain-containing phosphohydrolase [Roseiflexus sp.]|uniref:HD domain-containing phosphohydrolase n=1 Tax=Roseiflexus sp. TaxID=2562120 RepID=UPI0021DC1EED|nr:HD domain-containing phosphohydrolase [Roseiflexus sp.]GIV99766.1 MAG: phosphohydrolase [Roseiflexus sp.]